METIRLLLIEDNPVDVLSLKKALQQPKGPNFEISHVETLAEAGERLEKECFDVLLLDLALPDSHGLETLTHIRNSAPATPIIIFTGLDDEALAVEAAVRGEAQDYLLKDRFDATLLSRSINYAIERQHILNELEQANESTRRASAELCEKEDLLRTVFDVIADGFWDWDIETGLVKREASWPAILGYRLEEIEPALDSWKRLVHPGDLPRVMTRINSCLAGNADRYENEYRMKAKSGEWRWIQEYGRIIARDKNGKALRAVGALRDITAQKHAEQKSAETQKRLELALAGADLGWWELNLQTEEVFADDHGVKILGYSPREVMSRTGFWEKLIHPDDKPDAKKAFKRHLQGEAASYEIEHRVRTKSGEWKWILVRGKIFERDPEGKPLRMAGTYLNITDRKIAEAAIRQAEQRFRAIFEGAEDFIFLKDRSLKYTQVNPAFEKLAGLPASEIIGKKHEDLFGYDGSDHIRETELRVLEGETIEDDHVKEIRGVPMRFLATRTPLREPSGELVGIMTIMHDITDRNRNGARPSSTREEYPSKGMKATLYKARNVARGASTILLTGESGSGKDHLARYIHDHSDRANGPYFSINCAAIHSELAESELFGHERGAFTGAVGKKRGLLELAEGGTLLLNEIGELSLPLQAKLLTFLDSRKLTRVGGEKEISVNARLIAATNRNLEKAVEAGGFRKDLFYRLDVVSINVPPLRERLDDIPILVQEILAKIRNEMQIQEMPAAGPAVIDGMKRYHWPGNVRELHNFLERAVILSDGKDIDLRPLGQCMDEGGPNKDWSFTASFPFGGKLQDVTDELTKSLVAEALKLSNGKRRGAARALGISRDSLYRYMKKFGIEADD